MDQRELQQALVKLGYALQITADKASVFGGIWLLCLGRDYWRDSLERCTGRKRFALLRCVGACTVEAADEGKAPMGVGVALI